MFLHISDRHAPFRQKKARSAHSPWLTQELKMLMFERGKLKNIATRFKSNDNWTKYKTVRNQVNESIRLAKASYYNTYFKNNRGNIKNTWKGVNLIMGKNAHENRENAVSEFAFVVSDFAFTVSRI